MKRVLVMASLTALSCTLSCRQEFLGAKTLPGVVEEGSGEMLQLPRIAGDPSTGILA